MPKKTFTTQSTANETKYNSNTCSSLRLLMYISLWKCCNCIPHVSVLRFSFSFFLSKNNRLKILFFFNVFSKNVVPNYQFFSPTALLRSFFFLKFYFTSCYFEFITERNAIIWHKFRIERFKKYFKMAKKNYTNRK